MKDCAISWKIELPFNDDTRYEICTRLLLKKKAMGHDSMLGILLRPIGYSVPVFPGCHAARSIAFCNWLGLDRSSFSVLPATFRKHETRKQMFHGAGFNEKFISSYCERINDFAASQLQAGLPLTTCKLLAAVIAD